MSFINDDFLLSNDTARTLYHEHAADQPIYDYHCHLPPADLANDRQFDNLYDVWLAGDHYKWRAMRTNGVPERLCTGDADPFEKFKAYARTVPHTLRNPLYHWTHMELKRYFGIDTLLNEDTAEEVWTEANRQLKQMRVSDILAKFKVAVIGTTDDPADTLEHHAALRDNSPLADTAVYPAFRPDKCYQIADPAKYNAYIAGLEKAAGASCDSFDAFIEVIRARHDYFHEMGSRLSDHGLNVMPVASCTQGQARAIFDKVRGEQHPTENEQHQFLVYVMDQLGEMDADKGWAKQLHLGAMRNNNPWALENLGPDTGFDSIGDWLQAEGLSRYLGGLAGRNKMPKVVLYNLNPHQNYVFATMIGNFMDGSVPGKVQFGSGWWFCDQLEGMTWQMNALSNCGLLTRFVGMLTDSRSFLSYPRHEYFRRLLCELIGRDVEAGLLPKDMAMLGQVVENICFKNAVEYFGMALKGKWA